MQDERRGRKRERERERERERDQRERDSMGIKMQYIVETSSTINGLQVISKRGNLSRICRIWNRWPIFRGLAP